MKMITAFARTFTMVSLDGLAEYYEIMENGLMTAKNDAYVRAMAQIKAMELEGEEEYAEWDVARQELEATHEILAPNYFRFSYIVLLCLVIEDKLKELCEAGHEKRPDLPPYSKPKSRILASYRQYITSILSVQNLEWEDIEDLFGIRNCIVHSSGRVKEDEREKEIQNIAFRRQGITVSSTMDFRPDIYPLYLDDGMLVVQPEYCRQITRVARDFFEKLCNGLDLPKFHLDLS